MVKGNLRFPRAYGWLVVVSLLDVLFTCMILSRGGRELNPLADGVIRSSGVGGLLAYKYALLLVLVILCELFAGWRPRMGRCMASISVAAWGLPPAWAMVQLGLNFPA